MRDLGRCAFVWTDGRRCGERPFVEFHHVLPYGVGGGATVENVQLRCKRHNGYEARVFYARDAVGGEPGHAATSGPAWAAGATSGLSRGRSGTSRRDREVGPRGVASERARASAASGTGTRVEPGIPA